MLEKTTKDGKERGILNKMYSHQYRFEPLKPSAHALDQLLPSEQEVRLGNGTYASTMDISRIENLRSDSNISYYSRMKNAKNAYLDLLEKCTNPTHQLSDESLDKLGRRGLINKEGQPSDSVKNILLYLFEQDTMFNKLKKIATQVKLRDGTEEHYEPVKHVMYNLKEINRENTEAVSELHKLCENPNYTLKNDTAEVLKSQGLINEHTGQPHDSVKNIVLCSFDEESRQLRSPAMPFNELEKDVQKKNSKKEFKTIYLKKSIKINS